MHFVIVQLFVALAIINENVFIAIFVERSPWMGAINKSDNSWWLRIKGNDKFKKLLSTKTLLTT